MKKLFCTAVLLSSFITSSATFAIDGTTPQCSSGALNLVIENKDVSDCDNFTANCLYNTEVSIRPYGDEICYDDSGELWLNSNNSVSYKNMPKSVLIQYTAYVNGSTKKQKFKFYYNNGSVSDNCAQIFGPDTQCTISQTGDAHHKTYTLTIRKNA